MRGLEFALQFAAHGVPIFPVRVYRVGDRWRKEPYIKDWAARATTNPATIKAWCREWPDAFVGVPLERVGLVVVDADRHGGPDGVAALAAIELPPHQFVTTLSNGEHHFFRQPAQPIRSAYWHGGEVLGHGRFVVAYALEPFIKPALVLPHDLLERLPKARAVKGNGTALIQHTHGPQMVGAGRIPKSLYFEVLRLISLSDKVTRHHQRRVIGILRDIVLARRDHRNDGLNIGAYCFRELIPPVSRDAAEQLLFIAAQMNGYVAKDGEGAAIATIRSGLGSPIGGPCVCLGGDWQN
jgi:Bifunctional DNA primase/polymerase, N-terminal